MRINNCLYNRTREGNLEREAKKRGKRNEPDIADLISNMRCDDLLVYDGQKWVLANYKQFYGGLGLGLTGGTGEIGPTGPTGSIGPVGATGPRGLRGFDGEKGEEGPMGPRGLQGIVGIMGPTGPIGDIGLVGHTGPIGPVGATGPRGLRGLDGEIGPIGPTGPMGLEGLPGGLGPQGDVGPTGSMGLIGPTGARGILGFTGPVGPTGFVFIGDEKSKNTLVGLNLKSNKDYGEESVIIGYDTGKDLNGIQNVVIGSNAVAQTGSNMNYSVVIGAEAGFRNKNGHSNVFLGVASGSSNEGGTQNIFIGNNSGSSSLFGNSCICIGDGADTVSEIPVNQLVFGQGVTSFGDNSITFPSNLRTMPSGTEVSFSSAGGGCLYPVSSSLRFKKNIRDLSTELKSENLYHLNPVLFDPIEDKDGSESHIGLIAEEVDKYFPSLVPKDEMGIPASVKYSLLGVLILEEMKQIDKRVKLLEQKINEL